jgi:hypothetical protein
MSTKRTKSEQSEKRPKSPQRPQRPFVSDGRPPCRQHAVDWETTQVALTDFAYCSVAVSCRHCDESAYADLGPHDFRWDDTERRLDEDADDGPDDDAGVLPPDVDDDLP